MFSLFNFEKKQHSILQSMYIISILFFILLEFLCNSKNTLNFDHSKSQFSFCSFQYYNNNSNNRIESEHECYQKNESYKNITIYRKVLLVSSLSSINNITNIPVLFDSAYEDFIDLLNQETFILSQFYQSDLTIYISNETHYTGEIFSSETDFFRRVFVSINIQPLYCTEFSLCFCKEKTSPLITIFLKKTFKVFISLRVNIVDIRFKGNDLALINKNLSFSNHKGFYCRDDYFNNFYDENSEFVENLCGLNQRKLESGKENIEINGIFNLEILYDVGESLITLPTLSIKNCYFENFWILNSNISSLISINSIGAMIFLEKMMVINFFAYKNFIYSVESSEIIDFYTQTEWENLYFNENLRLFLKNNSYIVFLNNSFENRIFDYSFDGNFLFTLYNLIHWENEIYFSNISIVNINNFMQNAQMLFFSVAQNIKIVRFDHIYLNNISNIPIFKFFQINIKFDCLKLSNISLKNDIFTVNLSSFSFDNFYFIDFSSHLKINFQDSIAIIENLTINLSQNVSINFIEGKTYLKNIYLNNINSSYDIFYLKQLNFYLQGLYIDNVTTNEHIFICLYNEEILINQGFIQNYEIKSFFMAILSSNFTLACCYFLNSFTLSSLIQMYSQIKYLNFYGNVFHNVQIESFACWITSLIYLILEKNYFLNVSFLVSNYPFQILQGQWIMIKNVWENNICSTFSGLIVIQNADLYSYGNSFLFFKLPFLQNKKNIFCFHCGEIFINENNFVNSPDSFGNGIIYNEDSQKKLSMTKNNFILLNYYNISEYFKGFALFSSGTPFVELQNNFFSNLKCDTMSLDMKSIMGCINIQGVSTLSAFSNSFILVLKNNTFYNCSCYYGGSIGILNYNETYIEDVTANTSNAQVLGGFISILNCHKIIIKNFSAYNVSAQKGACIYALKVDLLEITNVLIKNSKGKISGSIDIRKVEFLSISNANIENSFSESGSFLHLIDSHASINKGYSYNMNSVFFGSAIFINGHSILKINDFVAKNCFSNKSGGFIYAEKGKNIQLFDMTIENSFAYMNGAAIFINDIEYLLISHVILVNCSAMTNGIIFLSSSYSFTLCTLTLEEIMCIGNQAIVGSCIFYSFSVDLAVKNISCIANNGNLLSFYFIYNINILILGGIFANNSESARLIQMENVILMAENLIFQKNSVESALFTAIKSQINLTNLTFFEPLRYLSDENSTKSIKIFEIQYSIIFFDKVLFKLGIKISNLFSSLLFLAAENSTIYFIEAFLKDNYEIKNSLFIIENSQIFLQKSLFFNNTGPLFSLFNSDIRLAYSFFKNNKALLDDTISNDLYIIQTESLYGVIHKISIENCNFMISQGISSNFYLINRIEIKNSLFIGHYNGNNLQKRIALFFSECEYISIINSKFINLKNTYGSAIYTYFSISTNTTKNALELNSNAIVLCEGEKGGAIYINFKKNFNITIVSNKFLGNFVSKLGASGLFIGENTKNSTFILKNNLFMDNIAEIAPNIFSGIYNIEGLETNFFSNNSDNFNMIQNITTSPFTLSLLSSSNIKNSSNKNNILIEVKSGETFSLAFEVIDALGQKIVYDSSSISSLKPSFFGDDSVNLQKIENSIEVCQKGFFNLSKLSIIAYPNTTFKAILSIDFYDLLLNRQSKLSQQLTFYSKPCEEGEILDINDRCQRCPENSYSFIIGTRQNQARCLSCPQEMAFCPGGDILIPKPGYWKMSRLSLFFAECENPDYCIGLPADLSYESLKINHKIIEKYTQIYQGTCLYGHEKNLCHECIKGYGKYFTGGKCVKCKEYDAVVYVRLFGVLFILIIYLLYTCQEIINFSKSSIIDEVSKIYINHFQRISLIMLLDFKNFIEEVKEFFSFANIFSFFTDDIFSNDCFVQKMVSDDNMDKLYFLKVFINYFVPLIICLICLILFVLRTIYIQSRQRKEPNSTNNNYFRKLRIIFLISVFLFYPLLTKCSLSLLNCISLDESKNMYMYSSPNLLCWSSSHIIYFLALGLSGIVIFGIGFPLILLFILRNHKLYALKLSRHTTVLKAAQLNFRDSDFSENSLNKLSIDRDTKGKLIKEKNLVGVYRFFYKDYKKKFFYWESIIFLQKFLLTLAQNLNQLISMESRNLWFFAILLTYLLLLLKHHPFKKKYVNNLERNSVLIAILTKFCFLVSVSDKISNPTKISFILFQLGLNIIFLVLIIYVLIRYGQWRKAYYSTLERFKAIHQKIKVIRASFSGKAKIKPSLNIRNK